MMKRVTLSSHNVHRFTQALSFAAMLRSGSYVCYQSMSEDLALAHTGRKVSDKGYWVFDGIHAVAEEIEQTPELHYAKDRAASLRDLCEFYKHQGLIG